MRALLLSSVLASGCYHYAYEHRAPAQGERLTRHVERVPTYVNGLVGTGRIDVTKYCTNPVRTELKVRATDVLLSIVTLLVYTPHTLYVTCGNIGANGTARSAQL